MKRTVSVSIAASIPVYACLAAAYAVSRCMGKQMYATDITLAVQMDCLPANVLQTMPRETLRDMRRRDLSRMIGMDAETAETIAKVKELARSRRAMRLVPALLRVIRQYERMLAAMDGGRRILSENSKRIVDVVRRIEPVVGLKKACVYFGISVSSFHSWDTEVDCTSSVLDRCRKRHPQQITVAEENVIRDYAAQPEFLALSRTTLYWQIIRDRAAAFSLSTFRKYLRALGLQRVRFRKKKHPVGIRASRAFEILHMDSTVFHLTEGRKVFINFIVDNYSRAILGWRVLETNRSLEVAENLRGVISRYGLKLAGTKIVTDDGSENCGDVLSLLEHPDVHLKKIVAQVDIAQSNSMVESVIKVVKNEYLPALQGKIVSIAGLERALKEVAPAYNAAPKDALFGLRPDEVLAGEIPRPGLFSEQLAEARAARRDANRLAACGVC